MKKVASVLGWVAFIALVAGIAFSVPVFKRMQDPFSYEFQLVGGDAYNMLNAGIQATVYAIFSVGCFIISLFSFVFSVLMNWFWEERAGGVTNGAVAAPHRQPAAESGFAPSTQKATVEDNQPQVGASKNRWYVLPIVAVVGLAFIWLSVSSYQKEKAQTDWVENFSKRTDVTANTVSESSAVYAPKPTETKPYGFVYDDEKEELYFAARSYVKEHLLSPSDAKFSYYFDCDYGKGEGDVYNVVGWVETENADGETIRETWSCMLKRSGDQLSLVMLDVGGKLYFE